MTPRRYRLVIAPAARRQLSEHLPEAVAAAAQEYITGRLVSHPYRLGKRLLPPLDDRYSAPCGTYRVLYRIDDVRETVTVLTVLPRSDAYRARG